MKLKAPKTKVRLKEGTGTIYVIKNIITEKFYVGQTEENDYTVRIGAHIRNAINGKRGYLYESFRKYGLENFVIYEIKYVAMNELDDWEYTYIIYYNSLSPNGYNALAYGQLYSGSGYWLGRNRDPETVKKVSKILAKKYIGDGNPFYGKHHSPETKFQASIRVKNRWEQMSEEQKQMYCKKLSKAQTGREVSEETKAKISKSNTGKVRTEEAKEKNRQAHLGKKHSSEHSKKISEALKGHKKKDTSKMVAAQRSRVSEEVKNKIIKIKELIDSGMTNNSIAAIMNCTSEYVRKIRKGERGSSIC